MASDTALKTRQESYKKKLKLKATSFLWIISFLLLANYLDLLEIVLSKSGFWHSMAILSMVGFLSCFAYITYYLPKFCNIQVNFDQWDSQIPGTIKIATSTGILFLVSSLATLWSELGIVSLLVLFVGLQGFISVFSFI